MSPESDPSRADEPEPPDLVEAGCYGSAQEAFEHGLVILALGAPFWLVPADSRYRLLVEPGTAPRASEQLACFDRESLHWPPPLVLPSARRRADLDSPAVWAALVIGSFWAQLRWPEWTRLGGVDAPAMFQHGQWWRPFTALFLHGDVGHLVSNLVGGFLVFTAVILTLGRARGWLLVALAAIGGNAVAAAAHHGSAYRSLGASTAIFAALGLLTGHALRLTLASHGRGWRRWFTPLGSGLVVLGLHGAGGIEIDVLAHATGFAVGLGLGIVAVGIGRRSTTRPAA